MNKQEFEKRIGLVITSEEYAEVEPLYMGDPKNRDKDAFCRHWLKDGGLQWLFDKRQGEINLKKMRLTEMQKELENKDHWIADMSRELSKKNKRIKELESGLAMLDEMIVFTQRVAAGSPPGMENLGFTGYYLPRLTAMQEAAQQGTL